jgi:hypothetical protein
MGVGVLCALLLGSFSTCDPGSRSVRVYFIPLAAQTYMPVTPENIEQEASQVFESNSGSVIRLLDAAGLAPGTAARTEDLNMIRIKIVDRCSGAAALVTRNKVVLKDARRRKVPTSIIRAALEEIVSAASRQPKQVARSVASGSCTQTPHHP